MKPIDPYALCVQYSSIEDGIKAHAEVYSFNIESKLFNQLTKEQQVLWRKEIEQACISGGEAGVELARDPRYKENLINQWRKAENELPKRIGDDSETVIITDGYFIHLGHYSFIHNTWLTEENYMYKNESIQYWLEIPELPKE
jgi:hypothetical protein